MQNYDIRYDDKYGVLSRARGKARARGGGAGAIRPWCAPGRDDPAWRPSPSARARTHGLADGRAGHGDPDRERLTWSACGRRGSSSSPLPTMKRAAPIAVSYRIEEPSVALAIRAEMHDDMFAWLDEAFAELHPAVAQRAGVD